MGGGVVGEGVMSVVWEGALSERGGEECCIGGGVVGEGCNECCMGGGVVGEGVMSVVWEGVLSEKG